MKVSSGEAAFEDAEKADFRVGRLCRAVKVQPIPEGRYATHLLMTDFGPALGIRKSLAKLTPNDEGIECVGQQVLALANSRPKC